MKKSIHLSILAIIFIPTLAISAPEKFPAEGESFLFARAALLRAKWQPVNMHLHDDYVFMGVEKEIVAHNFKEVASCSVDTSNCIFYYTRKGHCLRLDTIGEHVKEMVVVQWARECPDAPPKPEQVQQ